MISKIFIFFFTLGLIYFARFESFTFLFQKLIVPLIFLFLLLKNPSFISKIGIISLYLLFIVFATTSFVHSINEVRTLRFFQLMIGSFMLIFIYVVLLVKKPKLLNAICYALMVSAALFILTLDSSPKEIVAGRETGITSNPNLLGMFMLYSIFGVALLWREAKFKLKIFLTGILILSLYGIVVTASRKSLLSAVLFLSLWMIILFASEKNIFKILLFVTVAVVISYYSYNFIYEDSILIYRLKNITESGESRYDIATEGINIFKQSPLIGVGLGTFQEYSESGKYAHNDFFELLATLGIIGVIIYTSIYYWLIKSIRTVKRHVYDENVFYQLNLFLAIIMTMIVLGFGRPHFFDIFSMSIFGILAGYTFGVGLIIHKDNGNRVFRET